MKIGNYEIGPGAALAPMAGLTNPSFRRLCREMGASYTVTELISSHAISIIDERPRHRNKKLGAATLPLLEKFPGESPLAVQIFGRDPDLMSRAAAFVRNEGADIVDLNFGCPAKKIIKNGEGSGCALMLDPPLLQEIAKRVVEAVTIPVTAKIRIGWDDESRNAPEIAKRLADVGVVALTVHARTRNQFHSGPVDYDTLAEVCQSIDIPVIGNGGIRCRDDALKMTELTGCDRVAVGQATRGNPWIFSAIANGETVPSLADRVDVLKRHLGYYVEWAGDKRANLEMRKHAGWYLKGFPGAAEIRHRINQAKNTGEVLEIIEEISQMIHTEAPII
jgi:tRNA-dihydrouridine synthase B